MGKTREREGGTSLFKRALCAVTPLALAFALVPAMGFVAPQKAEANILTDAIDVAGSFYNGIKDTVDGIKDGSIPNNFGGAFLGTFENIGKQLADIDDPSGGGSTGGETIIYNYQVDLTEVENSLGDISAQLKKQNADINSLSTKISSASSSIQSSIAALDASIKTSTEWQSYNTALNTYYNKFNAYYSGVAYYEDLLNKAYASSTTTQEYLNNLYEKYYVMDGRNTGYLKTLIDNETAYLTGQYIDMTGMDVFKLQYRYFQLNNAATGATQYTTAQIAGKMKDFINYTYYTYTLSVYDYLAISLHMLACIEDSGSDYYTIGTTKYYPQQIKTDMQTTADEYLAASAYLFDELAATFGDLGNATMLVNSPVTGLHKQTTSNGAMSVSSGCTVYLPDARDVLGRTLGESTVNMFGDLVEFSYTKSGASSTLTGNALKVNATSGTITLKVNAKLANGSTHTLATYTITAKAAGANGAGTQEDPFVINSVSDWNTFATTSSYADKYVVLGNDIDFGGASINKVSYEFKGTFCGRGFTMKNGKLDFSEVSWSRCGLFPSLYKATICDLKTSNIIVDATISSFSTDNEYYTGVICGYANNSTFARCEVYCDSSTGYSGMKRSGSLTGSGKTIANGGIVGCSYNGTSVSQCVVTGLKLRTNIPVSNSYTGGLIGMIATSGYATEYDIVQNVTICHADALNGSTGWKSYIGGLIGNRASLAHGQIYPCSSILIKNGLGYIQSGNGTDTFSGIGIGKNDTSLNDYVYLYTGEGAWNRGNMKRNGAGNYPGSEPAEATTFNDLLGSYSYKGLYYATAPDSSSNNPFALRYTMTVTNPGQTDYSLNEPFNPWGIQVDLKCGNNKEIQSNIMGFKDTNNLNAAKAGSYTRTLTMGSRTLTIPLKVTHTHCYVQKTESPSNCQSIEFICLSCGATKTGARGSDHDWQQTSLTKASDTANGSIKYKCANCTQTKTEPIPKAVISVPEEPVAYGAKPVVTVTANGAALTEGTDYTLAYATDGLNGTVTVTGAGNYTYTKELPYTMNPMKISSATLKTTTYAYSGTAKKPLATVKCGTKVLTAGTDYTISYTANIAIGTAKAKITGKGLYAGTITKTFKINPAKTAIKSLAKGTKSFTVTWTPKTKAAAATGYQIRYSTKSTMASPKTVTVTSYKTKTKTVKSLKANKKYYVQIRTYKTVNGVKKYSDWSAKKYVTTK